MKRVFYTILPMVIMLLVLIALISFEMIFFDQISDLFYIEEVESFNTFNNGFILVIGGIFVFVLTKYTREINESIFRIFTFILNLLGIITIMTVFIRVGFIS